MKIKIPEKIKLQLTKKLFFFFFGKYNGVRNVPQWILSVLSSDKFILKEIVLILLLLD